LTFLLPLFAASVPDVGDVWPRGYDIRGEPVSPACDGGNGLAKSAVERTVLDRSGSGALPRGLLGRERHACAPPQERGASCRAARDADRGRRSTLAGLRAGPAPLR
jgi:hypothetical protein